ncbi:hypothetical protein LWI29_006926 [Acer saccharum]|uniref:Aquaporin NIP7-1 n=1 Tax=Acer saccharum TaxID=4024 RepID=A0AA39W830_ACESA|nr:hypothetical protein LWI29_006926 [Acer saccharum]
MKQYCFQQQPSPDISNCASTSSKSKDGDQQTRGLNTMSENKDVPLRNSIFQCFSNELDLNPARMVPFYVLAQTVGSVLGTYVGKSVYGVKIDLMATRPLQGCASAFWVELIATFIIVFLAAALTSEAQFVGNLSGFIVGVAIGLAVLITGPVSGGSMNPARSLGPAIVSWNFKDIWIYVTAPVIGAAAGAVLHHFLRLQPWLSHSLVLFSS